MVLEAERRAELADAVADDAHADLPIGDGLPDALGAFGRLDAGLAQDLLVGGLGLGRAEPSAGRNRAERADADVLQEERREVDVFMAGSLKVGPGRPSAAQFYGISEKMRLAV